MRIHKRCHLRLACVSLCVAFLLAGANSDAIAQRVPVLAYAANRNADPKRYDAFKRGLAELGYSDGKNIRIDYREGSLDTDYQQLMAEFVVANSQSYWQRTLQLRSLRRGQPTLFLS